MSFGRRLNKMGAYYIYGALMNLIARAGAKVFLPILLISYPIFLYVLPETGYDFGYYKLSYETLYYHPSAPLFFRSSAPLTAEPGWFLYTGLISLLTEDFRTFLAINFVLTVLIMAAALKDIGLESERICSVLALMIPVQFLILSFWSPRSALPLALAFWFLAKIRSGYYFRAVLAAIPAVLIHSQYGFIICFIAVYYILLRISGSGGAAKISPPVLFGTAGLIVVAGSAFIYLLPYLSFLPSYEVVESKSRYLNMEGDAFRVTALLSLVIFPVIATARWKQISKRPEADVILLMTIFSLIANVMFIDNAHVAGRLSRMSDYFLFGYLISEVASPLGRVGSTFAVVPIVLVFPFFFPDLYTLSELW